MSDEAKDLKNRIGRYVREKLLYSTLLGVRWMAPFVAGGGILIALAFLFDAASVDLASLTVSERAAFGSITTQAATLKNIGGITFNFMLPIFAGFMAYGIAGEEAFLTGFVGGYMTINSNAGFIGAMIAGFVAGFITKQVGQFTKRLPQFIRKAAPIIIYPVFNLLLMQIICYLIISPISSAIGTLFSGLLEFCMQKSTVVTGALSALFGCTLPAPHGGMFVLPVMGQPLLYLLALATGSLLTAVTLGMWKKDATGSEGM